MPTDLQDRRVEITGPVDRKMVINALNSGSDVFMVDFEDSCSPTWGSTEEEQFQTAGQKTLAEQKTPAKQTA